MPAAAADLADPRLAVTVKCAVRISGVPAEFHQDAVQEAWLGIVQASRRFRPADGVEFRSYAAPRARGQILDFMRRNDWLTRNHRRAIKRGEATQVSFEDDSCLERLGVQPLQHRRAVANEIIAAFAMLDPAYREVMHRRYLDDQNLCEIARQMDVSVSRVSQIHTRAIQQLRAHFKESESQ